MTRANPGDGGFVLRQRTPVSASSATRASATASSPPPSRGFLYSLLETYVGRFRPGHALIRMEEVTRHLPQTHFAWMGGADEDSIFYYRLHSPVILVEFDHQRGIALANDEPSRTHIHTIVRTPNGNDYGRDLLRQHHAQFDHAGADHRHA